MSAAPLVLGGDIGGTNTKLGLAALDGDARPAAVKRYASRDYRTLEHAVETFLSDAGVAAGDVKAACFAVAGPVDHGRAALTNLPWRLEETALARHLGIGRVSLINDFSAAGRGIALLAPSDLLTLQEGKADAEGDRVVVGAGTGLGVALLDWSSTHYVVHASEAGHTDFAPNDVVQDELLAYLRREFPHVSYERVVSGAGIGRILAFLEYSTRRARSPELATAMAHLDPARAIAESAIARRDELAVQALDLFASAYGSFAGNMALTMLAHGGVYVAGGIAPKIAAKLTDGAFIRAFRDKGRFRTLLESLPVRVVMNEHVGLLGALAEARRIAA